MSTLDVRSLPVGKIGSLHRLFQRMLGLKTLRQAEEFVESLVGSRPTYGDLGRLPAQAPERANTTSSLHVNLAAYRSLFDLLEYITPWTPICDVCEEYPLSNTGGKVSQLEDGAACPFCGHGHFRTPVTLLRRLNWATGELMEPTIADDHRARTGARVPLVDATILDWVGHVDASLQRACREVELPLYGLLAYVHRRLKRFDKLESAHDFLHDPFAFLRGESLKEVADAAKRHLLEREIWTVNVNPYLTDGRRRETFWSLMLGDRTYLVEGLLGRGDKCDVYRARWDHTPTEFVTIKLLAATEDRDLLEREYRTLQNLRRFDDVQSEFFLLFVPRLVSFSSATLPDGTSRMALVYAHQHQFDWTLRDVAEAFPQGVHPRVGVFLMNRLCELLDWLHGKRLVHSAVLPEHLLLKTQTHRLELLDWSYAVTVEAPMIAMSETSRAFYPEALLDVKRVGIVHDLAMACRTILYVLGSDPATGRGAPTTCPEHHDVRELLQLLYDHAMYTDSRPVYKTVAAFKEAFGKVARAIYGPPKYFLFEMPANRA